MSASSPLQDNGGIGKRRNKAKCSFCRNKRIKCIRPMPAGHLGFNICKKCRDDDDPCSEDFTCESDPFQQDKRKSLAAVKDQDDDDLQDQSRSYPEHSSQSSQLQNRVSMTPQDSPSAPSSITIFRDYVEVSEPLDATRFKFEILQALREFERLIDVLIVASEHRPFSCRKQEQEIDEQENLLRATTDKVHTLFVEICNLGLEIDSQRDLELAGLLLTRLLFATAECPDIYDSRKRRILVEVLKLFQRSGDHKSEQFVWKKLGAINEKSDSQLDEEIYRKFADSLVRTSKSTKHDLNQIWQTQCGRVEPPATMSLPPHLVASRLCTARTYAPVAGYLPGVDSHRGILDLHPIHVAAAAGTTSLVKALIPKITEIDIRDHYSRTPLYIAASKGHHECCSLLLSEKADPTAADSHGHSILEVAARAGDYDCVSTLVEWKADVNPTLPAECGSTPLQAALESHVFNLKTIYFLLSNNADPWVERDSDKANAITLAEKRGEYSIAYVMRLKCPNNYELPFDFLSSIDETVQPVPGPGNPGPAVS